MTDNVHTLPVRYSALPDKAPRSIDTPAVEVLDRALEVSPDLEILCVSGIRRDGSLFFATTTLKVADTLLALDRVRNRLMACTTEGDRFT